jgi:hypothetical protein
MAYFAQLDENNVVVRVVSVSNETCSDIFGDEHEVLGEVFCKNHTRIKNTWKQTSYNNNIRGRFAGVGYTYDSDKDIFIPPKPYSSWIFNEETISWNPPYPEPELTEEELKVSKYNWDEDVYQENNNTGWILQTFE